MTDNYYLTALIEGEHYMFLTSKSDGFAHSIVNYLNDGDSINVECFALTDEDYKHEVGTDKIFLEEFDNRLYNKILKEVVSYGVGIPNIFEGVSMLFVDVNDSKDSASFTAEQLLGDKLNVTDCTIKNNGAKNRSHLKIVK